MVRSVIVTCGLSLGVFALKIGPSEDPPNHASVGGALKVSPVWVFVAPEAVKVRVHEPQDDGSLVLIANCPFGEVP